jgi:hypothetical protein
MIDATDHQKELIEWKTKHGTFNDENTPIGKIGRKYWQGFLKRNQHKLRSKKGKKYDLDRSNWTTYLNFNDMYDHIESILVHESKIAEYLPEPVWMDKEGNEVSEENAFGCKVKIKYTRPDLAICCDEVGCNISQDGDGEIGGTKYVCHVDDEPKNSTSKKDSHFTCLGLTRFDGHPLMCVVLLTGKKRNLMVETGIDANCNEPIIGDVEKDGQYEFFKNNFGEGKLFPGGPKCLYKGKEVPCFVRFSDKGGMTGQILKEIFQTLDDLELFKQDREEGKIPFMLLDGHQSRFDLEFLRYINTYPHRWNVCIGVPYGTAFWQVGDSSEQNGCFNINMSQLKVAMLQSRMDQLNHAMQLVRTDIIPLVCRSFKPSFANRLTNKKALSERGWNPYNRNLLLDPTIRATITKEQLEREIESGLFPNQTLSQNTTTNQQQQSNSTNQISEVQGLNFSGGMAHYVSSVIMTEADRQSARDTAFKRKEQGQSLRDRVLSINHKMTAGKLVSQCRSHHLGVHVLEQAEARETLRKTNLKNKIKHDDFLYLKNCAKADVAIKLNTHQSTNVSEWNRDHIKDLIRPLKMPGDKAMPTNKPELYQRYLETRHRERRVVDDVVRKEYEDSLLVMDDYDMGENDDASVETDTHELSTNELTGTSL